MAPTADDTAREGEQIVYRRTGEIDVLLTTGWTVLPRPTFGQIKPLIRAQGRISDDLQGSSYAALAAAAKITAAAEALSKDGASIITQDNLDRLETLRAESRAAADVGEDALVSSLTGWWTTVFGLLLGDDKVPDEATWPSSFMDAKTPAEMIAHWRFVPRGPG